ncbi:MAG: alanine/glycine:cation symporter family protein [Verrucomicrobiota bacterium]|nr:alanine/glycine:cation symporter family protein [Verrucomicrobiota bacterium]
MKLRFFSYLIVTLGLLLPVSGFGENQGKHWQEKLDFFFGKYAVNPLVSFLFWEIPGTEFRVNQTPVIELTENQIGKFSENSIKSGIYTVVQNKKSPSIDLQSVSLENDIYQNNNEITLTLPYKSFEELEKLFSNSEGIIVAGEVYELQGFPLVVAWLLAGALFFTLKMRFVNLRLFKHAVQLVRGTNQEKSSEGEVTHFQALTTALSATVGLGNIAGVAIAIGTGGPGATFWMILVGFLGMSSKFTECLLGQKYRKVRKDGKIMGGAMHYLSDGLNEMGLKHFGGFLAGLFCVLCIGASFGGGNAFQVVQSLDLIKTVVPSLESAPWTYGILMTILVGLVILGGIKSIASVASKIVPTMCGIYLLACVIILLFHFSDIPAAILVIFESAFSLEAGFGGLIGVLIIGVKRAVFSNEAGIGSAAIAHSAAKVSHPAEEGIVALLEPFIDTIVVCTMTALVIIITGAYLEPANQEFILNDQGGALTSAAMGSVIPWFPYILAVAVFLFAFSTMISWSYYGERCWVWLFGDRSSTSYKILFLCFTFLGSVITAKNILTFSDLMILGMAFPNILGMLLLSGKVRKSLEEYCQLKR